MFVSFYTLSGHGKERKTIGNRVMEFVKANGVGLLVPKNIWHKVSTKSQRHSPPNSITRCDWFFLSPCPDKGVE